MSVEHIRTGDKTIARFRFVKGPEFLRKGDRLVFREGRTKAVGTVTDLFYTDEPPVVEKRGRRQQKRQVAMPTATEAIAAAMAEEAS